MRRVASERESGLENAERSRSSGHGRRLESPERTVSAMPARKRRAELEEDCWASVVVGPA